MASDHSSADCFIAQFKNCQISVLYKHNFSLISPNMTEPELGKVITYKKKETCSWRFPIESWQHAPAFSLQPGERSQILQAI